MGSISNVTTNSTRKTVEVNYIKLNSFNCHGQVFYVLFPEGTITPPLKHVISIAIKTQYESIDTYVIV